MVDYTLVVGVDRYHLEQLAWTWPTWRKHKPSLLDHPMLIFCDTKQIGMDDVRRVVDHPDLMVVEWNGVQHVEGDVEMPTDKWSDPQRYKMLSGFVHVPADHVNTKWWLKLDTDVVASGQDNWIDPSWFDGDPAIVCQPWGFTKPADQMLKLDRWVESNAERLRAMAERPPLNLAPAPGSDRVRHKRIISWCGFFSTALTSLAARWADATCGRRQLPVRSQDGLLWYVAIRLGLEVKRVQMKRLGWQHWSTMANVRAAAERALPSSCSCSKSEESSPC